MEWKRFSFVVFILASVAIMFLTFHEMTLSYEILQSHVLRGENETQTVIRFKIAKKVVEVSEIWKQQRIRLSRIRTVCKRLNRTPSFTPPRGYTSRLLVNDYNKVLLGFIPKIGCTTWKGVFSKSKRVRHEHTFSVLSRFNDTERETRLQTYRKVLFVRDPIRRFLSAYLSKFRKLGNTQRIWERMYGLKILKLYRLGSEELLKNAQASPVHERPFFNITLSEFIRFITDLGDKFVLHGISDHWLPQHIVSHACEIPYDFIGKYENLGTEAPFVLDWVGMTPEVNFPEIHSSRAATYLAEEYSKVPLGLMEDLRKYYSLDFELFGYDSIECIANITRDIFKSDILE